MYDPKNSYGMRNIGRLVKTITLVGLAALLLSSCAPKYSVNATSEPYFKTVEGEVINDKLEPFDQPGLPMLPTLGMDGKAHPRGKGSYEFTIRTKGGKEMKFWRAGDLVKLIEDDRRINPGSDVSVEYVSEPDKWGYIYRGVELD